MKQISKNRITKIKIPADNSLTRWVFLKWWGHRQIQLGGRREIFAKIRLKIFVDPCHPALSIMKKVAVVRSTR